MGKTQKRPDLVEPFFIWILSDLRERVFFSRPKYSQNSLSSNQMLKNNSSKINMETKVLSMIIDVIIRTPQTKIGYLLKLVKTNGESLQKEVPIHGKCTKQN